MIHRGSSPLHIHVSKGTAGLIEDQRTIYLLSPKFLTIILHEKLYSMIKELTFGQIIPFVVIVFRERMGYVDPQWWPGTKNFTVDRFNVWQILAVLKIGKSMRANNTINLGLRFLLNIWIFSHVIKK